MAPKTATHPDNTTTPANASGCWVPVYRDRAPPWLNPAAHTHDEVDTRTCIRVEACIRARSQYFTHTPHTGA